MKFEFKLFRKFTKYCFFLLCKIGGIHAIFYILYEISLLDYIFSIKILFIKGFSKFYFLLNSFPWKFLPMISTENPHSNVRIDIGLIILDCREGMLGDNTTSCYIERDTHIPSDRSMGIHETRGYPYHCNICASGGRTLRVALTYRTSNHRKRGYRDEIRNVSKYIAV